MTDRSLGRIAFVFAACAWFCGAASLARADDPADSDEIHVQRGVKLRGEGRDREALSEFEAAWELRRTPRTRAQIALASQAIGEWVEAERGLREALQSPDDPWIHRYRAELQQALAVTEQHLGWLSVETHADGAELIVEGDAPRALPLAAPLRVASGPVRIEVRAERYVSDRRTANVRAGEPLRVFVVLTHESLPTPLAVSREAPLEPPVRPAARPATTPSIATQETAGMLALSAAGAFGIAGFGAWRVRTTDIGIYDDDARCLVGGLTRDQRCGAYRRAADAGLVVEISAFAAAGLAGVAGGWLWVISPPQSGPTASDARSSQRAAGALMLGAGGVLALAGISAWRARTDAISTYNDPRCVEGSLTREQRCGVYREMAADAFVVEVGAFAGAAVIAIAGGALLVKSTRPGAQRIACAPGLGAGVMCSGGF